ncbi:hypothetical protein Ancab_038332 [Ancistrocladus abbreviatus]
MWLSVSKPARNLIERMQTRDASARIAAEEVLGHPWVMFYTEHTLKSLSIKLKLKTRPEAMYEADQSSQLKLNGPKSKSADSSEGLSTSISSSKCWVPCDSLEPAECELLDALTVAISQVRISEPKWSRLCGSLSSIQQQCSANSLCKAF